MTGRVPRRVLKTDEVRSETVQVVIFRPHYSESLGLSVEAAVNKLLIEAIVRLMAANPRGQNIRFVSSTDDGLATCRFRSCAT